MGKRIGFEMSRVVYNKGGACVIEWSDVVLQWLALNGDDCGEISTRSAWLQTNSPAKLSQINE